MSGTSRQAPGRALLILVLGVVLTVVSGVVAWQSRPPEDFGAPPVTLPATPVATPAQAGPASPAPAVVPVRDGSLPDASGPDSAGMDGPVRLRIPALDLNVPVDAVGIDPATGDLAVPSKVSRVGWYRYGPGFAADAGSIVVTGHVDSADQGEGAFFRLGSLTAGDEVTLAGPGGRTRTFEVVARERFRKTAIPLQDYFVRDGPVRLTLITCGGPFDSKTRHYRNNVVVTAVPRAAIGQ